MEAVEGEVRQEAVEGEVRMEAAAGGPRLHYRRASSTAGRRRHALSSPHPQGGERMAGDSSPKPLVRSGAPLTPPGEASLCRPPSISPPPSLSPHPSLSSPLSPSPPLSPHVGGGSRAQPPRGQSDSTLQTAETPQPLQPLRAIRALQTCQASLALLHRVCPPIRLQVPSHFLSALPTQSPSSSPPPPPPLPLPLPFPSPSSPSPPLSVLHLRLPLSLPLPLLHIHHTLSSPRSCSPSPSPSPPALPRSLSTPSAPTLSPLSLPQLHYIASVGPPPLLLPPPSSLGPSCSKSPRPELGSNHLLSHSQKQSSLLTHLSHPSPPYTTRPRPPHSMPSFPRIPSLSHPSIHPLFLVG